MAWSMKADAEEEIKKQRSYEIARGMKDKGFDVSTLAELTGLRKEAIEKL